MRARVGLCTRDGVHRYVADVFDFLYYVMIITRLHCSRCIFIDLYRDTQSRRDVATESSFAGAKAEDHATRVPSSASRWREKSRQNRRFDYSFELCFCLSLRMDQKVDRTRGRRRRPESGPDIVLHVSGKMLSERRVDAFERDRISEDAGSLVLDGGTCRPKREV